MDENKVLIATGFPDKAVSSKLAGLGFCKLCDGKYIHIVIPPGVLIDAMTREMPTMAFTVEKRAVRL